MVAAPRFCPFCREPFDGETCPDHGLALVDFQALPKRSRIPAESERLAIHDLRFGRGLVLGASLLILVGMALPAVIDGFADGARTSGFALFQFRAGYLSVVPGVAVVAAGLAMRRASRAELSRMRLALAIAALVALIAVVVAGWHVANYAQGMAAGGHEGAVEIGSGTYVVVLGLGALLVGVLRLGRE